MSGEGSSQRAITRAERVDQLLGGEGCRRLGDFSALNLVHGALAGYYEFGREHSSSPVAAMCSAWRYCSKSYDIVNSKSYGLMFLFFDGGRQNARMLSPPSRAGERAAELAKRLGLTVGETTPAYGRGQPAVSGAADGVAAALKAYGARWSVRDKALVFASWPTLEGVLAAVLKEQGERQ